MPTENPKQSGIVFLETMDALIPWEEVCAVVAPDILTDNT